MKTLTSEDWTQRVAPYNFPDDYRWPIATLMQKWQGQVDPLGAVLELVKWGRIAHLHGVRGDVLTAQFALESGFGLHVAAPAGVKASADEIAKGLAKRLRTRELLRPAEVQKFKDRGDLVEIVRDLPDGRQEIVCYCWFFVGSDPNAIDDLDFEKFLRVYEHHPERLNHLATAEDFITNVTAKFYATGLNYGPSLLQVIKDCQLGHIHDALGLPAAG